jgi:flagellar biosynthesis protein FlhF
VDVVYTPGELQEAVSKHTDKDLILIDTAGRSHKNSEQMSELKNFLDVSEPTDIFLVLSATTRYQDMIEIANSYSDIPVSRMIFTKLDETSTFGAILNIISKTQKCLSYVTVGQNVPEDIEIADPIKIAKMITRER